MLMTISQMVSGLMGKTIRGTGIKKVEEISSGTHICHFYHTKEDLLDIPLPYLKAGLEDNEFCIWFASEPLGVEDASASLKQAIGNLDDYIKRGQIEIIDASQCYASQCYTGARGTAQGLQERKGQIEIIDASQCYIGARGIAQGLQERKGQIEIIDASQCYTGARGTAQGLQERKGQIEIIKGSRKERDK